MLSLMPVLYDARGNRYVVASPDQIPDCGRDAQETAATSNEWALDAVTLLCHRPGEFEAFSDGLIVGPFDSTPPFSVLIVNTDGSLAERSGNGLTIFAQALRDAKFVDAQDCFDVDVYHMTPGQPSPTRAVLTVTDNDGAAGVWVAMGHPEFGPSSVGANATVMATSTPRRDTNHIAELAAIDSRWSDSVLVRIGNPHCVTWLGRFDELPSFDALGTDRLYDELQVIAFNQQAGKRGNDRCTSPFSNGINLQWAARLAHDRLAARIFERGEGPTRSSGSSATAVACAARQLGLVTTETVTVEMPGGNAQVRFTAAGGNAFAADYLGVAKRVAS